ncbi:MAG: glycosyltransferase family 2 protein [Planctomycetaceae bacterium]
MASPRYLTALPVYNEESSLLEVLDEVRQYAPDILVVDDGSTDGTPALLRQTAGIMTVRHEPNQGYGAALRTAFQYAIEHGYDALVTIDCDGQHQPGMIPELVDALFSKGDRPADIISGSRYLKEFAGDNSAPEDRRRINHIITQQINSCFGLKLTDTFCGFKAYRTEALQKFDITELGYAMPLQLWVQAVRHNMEIVEYPVPRIYLDAERSFGGSLDDSNRRLNYYREVLLREMNQQQVGCLEDLPSIPQGT